MRTAQFTAQEVLNVFRRRKKYFYIPLLVVFFLSVCGAFFLPRKYASTTTILVQRDEILNPLISYTMAVSTASEDRLRTFNEITYSLLAIQTLIDSLDLGGDVKTEEERQELIDKIRKHIETERPGSATFRVTYLDSDPVRAQRGAAVLAGYFIKTVLQVENQRNELAVQFFEQKLEELRKKFEVQQAEVVSLMRNRIEQLPVENRTLWGNMDDIDKSIGAIDERLRVQQRALNGLRQFNGDFSDDKSRQLLFDLQRVDIPHSADLRPLVTKYEELSRRYTARFPEIRKLSEQIVALLAIIRNSLEAEVTRSRRERWELEQRRFQLVDDLKRATSYQEIGKDKKSSFDIIRGLYDEMKVKLEQARTTRDLGRKGSEQFILIDPPIVPTEPSKPNKPLIMAGGLGLGFLLGIFSIALAELLDSTIRRVHDVYVYKKRVIAFIPEGTLNQTT